MGATISRNEGVYRSASPIGGFYPPEPSLYKKVAPN
jgi:hypothetical protein